MKIEQIFESKDFPTFHITDNTRVISILKQDRFNLSAMVVPSEYETWKKNKPAYFLSLARSTNSSFIRSHIGHNMAILKIDTSKITQRHKTIPVDYWSDRSNVSEMEERIFSYKQHIENASSYIMEIHVVVPNYYDSESITTPKVEQIKHTLMLYKIAKQKGIDIYLYEDQKDALKLNKKTSNSYFIEKFKEIVNKLAIQNPTNKRYREDKEDRAIRPHIMKYNYAFRFDNIRKMKVSKVDGEPRYRYASLALELIAKLVQFRGEIPENARERENLVYELQDSLNNYRKENDYANAILRGNKLKAVNDIKSDLSSLPSNQKIMSLYYRMLNKTKTRNIHELVEWLIDKWSTN